MSTDVQAEAVIARPRAEVAAYAMDWRNDREWIGALSEVRLVGGGDGGVGSRVARVARFLGRRIEYVNEITELEPGRRLAMRSVKAPFPITVVYEFEDAGAGTRMRIRALGNAGGFYRIAAPVLAAAVERGVSADLARLKARLEGS